MPKRPFTGGTRGHIGVGLMVPIGTPIQVALFGAITAAQYHSSYSYYMVIDHGSSLSIFYAHNSQLLM